MSDQSTAGEPLAGDEAVLARRYRMLMRAYPKRWRTERGAAMLGTLLDASAAGQRRPGPRESASIVWQGLRERLDLRRRRSPGEVWSGGLRIGALVMLGQAFATVALEAVRDPRHFQAGASPYPLLAYGAAVILGIPAMAALAAGRTVVAAVLTGFWALAPAPLGQLPWQLIVAAVITAGLSITDRQPRRQRTSAVWLGVVPLVAAVWFGAHLVTGEYFSPADALAYPVALLLALTVGVVADPRLLIAVAALTAVHLLTATLDLPGPMGNANQGAPIVHPRPQTAVLAMIVVLLLTIGQLRARRMARI